MFNADYFVLLAMCFVGAKESGPRRKMYADGLSAAQKALALETDADKIPRRVSVVGMVHFYFSDVAKAIETVEGSLKMLAPLKSVLLRLAESKEEVTEALGHLEKALAATPNDIDYNKHLAIAKATLQSFP